MNAFSYWEQQGFGQADWVVIGAGFVGLQSARRIKETYPKQRVMVLDSHAIGNAASLRNAGFACFGSAGEMLDEIERTSLSEALQLYEKRYQGIQILRERYGSLAIGYEPCGGMEVFLPEKHDEFAAIESRLDFLNKELKTVHNSDAYHVSNPIETGMRVLKTAISSPLEGSVLTHQLYSCIREDALRIGVELYEGMQVLSFSESSEWVEICLPNSMPIRTRQLLICTNGFTQKLLPTIDLNPARGQVFVTEVLSKQPLNGIYHADKGYLYFRSLGDRILIGGGRNQDFLEEKTTEMRVTDKIRTYIKDYMERVVLPGQAIRFQYEWSGIMGMHENRNPIIRQESRRIFLAVRMGGMGVALSAWVANQLLNIIQGAAVSDKQGGNG
ncbi:MAG: hypothetical protein CK532_01860 [Flavobacteriales bacterium]|nr:MAG: hypothetical protein CK532_01860 [Flavobacteriales bacterium]